MAEDSKKSGDESDGKKSGGSKKKLIIIVSIVALIAVGAGVGVTLMLKSKHDDKVADTEEVGCEDIALQGHPVTVPAIDMNDGFYSLLMHENTAGQCTHSHDAIVHIRNNDGINTPFDTSCIGNKLRYIHSFGRIHLSQHNKFT